jgi:hypothetical protein
VIRDSLMQGLLHALGNILPKGFCLVVFETREVVVNRKMGTEVDVICGGRMDEATAQEMEAAATALHELADSLSVDAQASGAPGSGRTRSPKLQA